MLAPTKPERDSSALLASGLRLPDRFLRAALRANPFVVLIGPLLVAGPLGVARRWQLLPYRARTLVIGAVLISSELWQLHRVGLLG